MLQWCLCKSHIYIFFLSFLLIWNEDRMRWGKKTDNNILLDVQYRLKTFLLLFLFLSENVSEGAPNARQWRCLSFLFSPALKWNSVQGRVCSCEIGKQGVATEETCRKERYRPYRVVKIMSDVRLWWFLPDSTCWTLILHKWKEKKKSQKRISAFHLK